MRASSKDSGFPKNRLALGAGFALLFVAVACGSESVDPGSSSDPSGEASQVDSGGGSPSTGPSVQDAGVPSDARATSDGASAASDGSSDAEASDASGTNDAPSGDASLTDASTATGLLAVPDGLYQVPVIRYGTFFTTCKNSTVARLTVEKTAGVFRVYGPTFYTRAVPAFWPMWFANGHPASDFTSFPVVADVDTTTGDFQAAATSRWVENAQYVSIANAYRLAGTLTFVGGKLSVSLTEQNVTVTNQPTYSWSGYISSTRPGQTTLPAGVQRGTAPSGATCGVRFLRDAAGSRTMTVDWLGDLMAPVTPGQYNGFQPPQLLDPSCSRGAGAGLGLDGTVTISGNGSSCTTTAPAWFMAP